MLKRSVYTLLACALCAVASVAPALADISGGAGIITQSGGGSSSTGPAVFLSSGKSVPIVPASVDVTGLLPLGGKGGYAVTLEGRVGAAGIYGGAGYGIGQLGGAQSTGVFTAFVGTKVAPLTSVELRGYKASGNNGASAAFIGVRFSI
ncbi:MAG TPA: hypothetical protein VIG51_08265 [Candidatus Baltobacteraceae bacterium]|jgi:hypothetical protein